MKSGGRGIAGGGRAALGPAGARRRRRSRSRSCSSSARCSSSAACATCSRSTRASGATTFSSSTPTTRGCASRRRAGLALRGQLLERVRAVPGVADAALARLVPLGGRYWNEHISVEGTEIKRQNANFNQVGPGYFRAIGTALLAGRDFNDRDDVGSGSRSRSSRRRSPASTSPAPTRSAASSRSTTREATPSSASRSSASCGTPSTTSSARTSTPIVFLAAGPGQGPAPLVLDRRPLRPAPGNAGCRR